MELLNINDWIGLTISADKLRELQNAGHDVVRTHDDQCCPSDDVYECDREGTLHSHSSQPSTSVHISARSTETWNPAAVDESAFYCHTSDLWFSQDVYTEVEDYVGNIVCRQYCIRYHEMSRWDSDGEYHYCEEESHGVIRDYHHSSKPWEGCGFKWKPKMIGVELEVWAEDRNDAAEYADSLGLACEHDSTLCGTHGFEVIGEPMEFSEFAKANNPWQRFCENSGVKSWHGRNGTYGMHVSINVQGCSLLNVTKAIVFIHNNVQLCEAVAGRNSRDWAQYYSDVTTKNALNRSGSHSAAVSWNQRRGRFELRIFRGNAKWEGFLRNVEFTHSIITFARQAKITKGELTDQHYTQWMTETPRSIKDYPTMVRWLRDRQALRDKMMRVEAEREQRRLANAETLADQQRASESALPSENDTDARDLRPTLPNVPPAPASPTLPRLPQLPPLPSPLSAAERVAAGELLERIEVVAANLPCSNTLVSDDQS